MASAHSAGQWNQAQRTKAALPYILYVRTTSADPRVEHLTWVGLILPIDDPWWSTHWPPNGWGCRCSIRQITARERDKLLATPPKDGGVSYATEIPDNGPPRTFRNARTREITTVPAGIDPGWVGNPGRDRAQTLVADFDASARVVQASNATMREKVGKHGGDRAVLPETFARVQQLLDAGRSIDEGRPRHRSIFARLTDGLWQAVVKTAVGGRELILSSLHAADEGRLRQSLKRSDQKAGR